MTDSVEHTIEEIGKEGIKRAKGDEGEVWVQDIADLIAADKYLAGKKAQSKGFGAMVIQQAVPPGTV